MRRLLLPVMLLALAGCGDPSTPVVASAPVIDDTKVAEPVAAGPVKEMNDGTYQVGVDVIAGRYKTTGPDKTDAFPMCSWSRNKDDSGEFDSIISNGISQGPGSITIKKGEFVVLSGGCSWRAA